MIKTYIPFFRKKDGDILKKCLRTNFVSTVGPLVKKFEDTFSQKYNFKYSIALNSGTSALQLGLKAIGVEKNDIVILPSYTFAATANAVIYNNATPWLFDCDTNFDISLSQIEEVLKNEAHFKKKKLILNKNGAIIKALVPVSAFGKKLDFSKLLYFAEKYKLKILFDTAACHDPNIFDFKKNKKMHFCFSFNGNKTLTTGAGGMLSTNSEYVASKIRVLSNVGKNKNYNYKIVGYNYRMTNIQAALGLAQLDNIKNILKIKKKIFYIYYFSLFKFKNIKLIYDKKNVNWLFALTISSAKKFKIINNLFKKNNIEFNNFWKPLHLQKIYKKYQVKKKMLVNSIWKKVIVLPSHPGLKKVDQNKIVKILLNNLK